MTARTGSIHEREQLAHKRNRRSDLNRKRRLKKRREADVRALKTSY